MFKSRCTYDVISHLIKILVTWLKKKDWLLIIKFTPRNDSVRSGFCHLEIKPMLIWFFAGSVPVRFDLIWTFTDLKPAKRVHIKTLRCIANKYIYMHLAYAACAHAKKNFFSWNLLSWFVAFQIRLNFANQMKTELSYKLWS